MIELYQICGYKIIDTVPEYISLCSYYCYKEKEEQSSENNIVIIIDMGYICTNVCLFKKNDKECKILANEFSKEISGRLLDNVLLTDVINQLKININPKLYFNLMKEVVEMKEMLGTDGDGSIYRIQIVDNMKNYVLDYSYDELLNKLSEIQYETKLYNLMNKVINESGIKEDERKKIKFVMYGGILKIDYLQQIIHNYMQDLEVEDNYIDNIRVDEGVCFGNIYYNFTKSDKWSYNIIYNKFNLKGINDNNLKNRSKIIKEKLQYIIEYDNDYQKFIEMKELVDKKMYLYNIL